MPTIKELRLERKLTQSELGSLFANKKAPETICRWENGLASPSAKHLQEMAMIFGVPAEKILLK